MKEAIEVALRSIFWSSVTIACGVALFWICATLHEIATILKVIGDVLKFKSLEIPSPLYVSVRKARGCATPQAETDVCGAPQGEGE